MASPLNFTQLNELYLAYFGRPVDYEGYVYYTTHNATLSDVAAAFAGSAESQALYGSDVTMMVTAIYQNLFNRAPEPAGLAYWTTQIISGAISAPQAALQILLGAQGSDATAVANKLTASQAFFNAVDTTAEINGYSGNAANASARLWLATVTSDPSTLPNAAAVNAAVAAAVNAGFTANVFTLTPHVDVATAGAFQGSLTPFFYDGTGPTLNTGDTLTGANTATGANNTLLVTDNYGVGADIMPAGVSLSNIQSVTLNTAGNAGQASALGGGANAAFDTSGFASVTSTTVLSSGGGTDTVQASNGSAINVTHNGVAGGVNTLGGNNVTVTTKGTGGVSVGAFTAGSSQVLPTGAVTVNANGIGGGAATVAVIGGTSVTVNVSQKTATGNIDIGNDGTNGGPGAATAAFNPTGAISVTSASTAGAGNVDTIFGGTTVTVNVKGDSVNVGDAAATVASNQPSGAVIINDLQPVAFDNLTGTGHSTTQGGAINEFGGTSVTVNSNTGNFVFVGNTTGGGQGLAGTLPSGDVSVTQTGADLNGAYGIGAGLQTWNTGNWTEVTGGANVTVNSAGGDVWVGSFNAANTLGDPTGAVTVNETINSHAGVELEGGTSVTVNAKGQQVWIGDVNAPSGAVTVNQSSVYTGNAIGATQWAQFGNGNQDTAVNVFGGTSATINTTGGNVTVGRVAGSTAVVPSGAVNITNTFSGANTANGASVAVLGGTTVNISVPNGTSGNINVGNVAPALNTTGTALSNGALFAHGNVSIMNGSLANGFGTSANVTVGTLGATEVDLTGATGATIFDANTFKLTGVGVAGNAAGTSTLNTVNLDGVTGTANVDTNASALSLGVADTAFTTVNVAALSGSYTAVPAHTDTLTLNNATVAFNDATATAITVGTSGTKADALAIAAAKATAMTFNNGATLTVGLTAGNDPLLASITATNSGSLNLGDLTAMGAAKLATITATGATGMVSVGIDPTKTAFNAAGSTGQDVVTINGNTISVTVAGGTNANNTLVANYGANAADTPLGTNTKVSGFTTLEVAGANAGTHGTGAGHTFFGGSAAVPAVQQVDKIDIGGTIVAGTTFTATVNGHVYNYVAGLDATPTSVAQGLETVILTSGTSGVQVSYTGGNQFTLTAPVAGTGFTDVLSVNNATATVGTGVFTNGSGAVLTSVAQQDAVEFTGSKFSAGDTATITVNGNAYTVPVSAGESLNTIAGALATLINADPTAVVTAVATNGTPWAAGTAGVVEVTAKVAGTPFTFNASTVDGKGDDLGDTLWSGTGLVTANRTATQQVDTEALSGTYAAGNQITLNVNGGTLTFTVGTANEGVANLQTLANDLVIALNGGGLAAGHGSYTSTVSGVTATDAGGTSTTVTITYNTAGVSHTDSGSVASGAAGTETLDVASIANAAAVAAVPANGVYDATNFTALIAGVTNAATPDIIFTNVKTGTPLSVIANQAATGVVDYVLANSAGLSDTLPLTVGVDGSTTGLGVTVLTSGVENIALNSVGKSGTNVVTVGDTAAKSITITGDSATTLTLATNTNGFLGEGASSVTSIDASGSSGAVNVLAVSLKNAAAHTITGGTGGLTAAGGFNPNDVDTINTGTGGSKIFIGAGGSWGTQDVFGVWGYSAGSETINLAAPTGTKTNIVVAPDGAVATFNGTRGGVNGFDVTVTSPDRLAFSDTSGTVPEPKATIPNVTAATVVNTLPFSAAAAANIDPLGLLINKLGNLAFTSSNGVITFSAVGTHQLSEFSTADLIYAAEIIVSNYGGNRVAEFTTGGNTYVVTSDPADTLATNPNWQFSNFDSVIELMGVSNPTGLGYLPAGGAVAVASAFGGPGSDSLAFVPGTVTAATSAANSVYDATGISQLQTGTGNFVLGTTSTVVNNLAPSSWMVLAGLGAAQTLTTNQTGAAGTNAIGFSLTGANGGTVTVNGDLMVQLKSFADSTLKSLTDGTGTVTSLKINDNGAAHALDVQAISASALSSIDASSFSGALTLGDGTALSQANLTIKLGAGNDTVTANGAANVITDAGGTIVLTANGAGDNITVVSGTVTANGQGDTITLTGAAATTLHAAGSDTIVFKSGAGTGASVIDGGLVGVAHMGIGNGSHVTFDTNAGGSQQVYITGDVGGTAAAANLYLNNAAHSGGDMVTFNNQATETWLGQVNVSGAASLTDALNLAAATAAMSQQAGGANTPAGVMGGHTGLIDWFQFGGNTYIVEAINSGSAAATHTALGAGDVVVQITGLVDLTNAGFGGHTVTL